MSSYENFLKKALKKYKNADIVKADILDALVNYTDLRPRSEDFVFNDGSVKNLLQLDGTIPVHFKANVYNIPICIWVMDSHPYESPMVYVKPTSTMQIKEGRNVDSNGKVDLPCLRGWKYPVNDLLGLLQVLVIVFGKEPPVYSKSQLSQPLFQNPEETQAKQAFTKHVTEAMGNLTYPEYPGSVAKLTVADTGAGADATLVEIEQKRLQLQMESVELQKLQLQKLDSIAMSIESLANGLRSSTALQYAD